MTGPPAIVLSVDDAWYDVLRLDNVGMENQTVV